MTDYPYPENPGATHFEGCWKTAGHMSCTVAKVYELERELTEVRGERKELIDQTYRLGDELAALRLKLADVQRDLEVARRERDAAYERAAQIAELWQPSESSKFAPKAIAAAVRALKSQTTPQAGEECSRCGDAARRPQGPQPPYWNVVGRVRCAEIGETATIGSSSRTLIE